MKIGSIMTDFLPPPHLLVPKDDSVKVTLALSGGSVAFFKREAKKCGVPYQRMIRALLDEYARRQGQ
jgi:predicted DNA binding CopG/RHH family protein